MRIGAFHNTWPFAKHARCTNDGILTPPNVLARTECPQPDSKKSETGHFESHFLDPRAVPVQYQNVITVFPTRCASQQVRLLRPHAEYKTSIDELVKTKVAEEKDAKMADAYKEASAVLDALSKLDVTPKALATTPWTVFSANAMGMLFAPRSPLFRIVLPAAALVSSLPGDKRCADEAQLESSSSPAKKACFNGFVRTNEGPIADG
jgi:hypothetical protein